MDRLKTERVRESTRANYYGIWRTFNEFFIKLDIKPQSWEERLVLFAGYLADSGRKACTIKSYVSAITAVLKEDGVEVNENRFLLSAITKACTFSNEKVWIKFPIQKGILKILLLELENVFQFQPYLEKLYKALFVTAYFGLFRVGELTMGTHPVKAKDVHIGFNKNKLMFILHTSKTHWKNVEPQVIKISSYEQNRSLNSFSRDQNCINTYTKICPYSVLRNYLNIRKKAYKTVDEPFFIFKDRTPVKPANFNSVLKMALRKAGLNVQHYSSSGFRSGRAVDLLSAGVSVESIRKIGRWRSGAVYRYFKTV